ncbi:FKBP-type peptidyl-prolyl cis-trans isomerase [Pedobacter sp. SYP-B3415]|uniref:FKBP-type peptidyl-prolyl cis-trans isomerase n=1 Tax=Pedobacter sp. SYP-B3415 TaxID=2496641 RepID=UPI00101CA534|nr:FKBP-type peptidyl-prolyl cis-trans isomerase [Pedobacter sp. SYP-B3415]
MKIKYLLGVLLLFSVVFTACKKEYESIESVDERIIQEYLQKNGLNATKDPSGFYYVVTKQGSGELLKNTDSVFYRGEIKSLKTGVTYYSSSALHNLGTYVGYSATFVGVQIEAIQKVMLSVNRGSEVRILLPSHMAFGKNGDTQINVPENEVIDFKLTIYPEATQAERDDNLIKKFLLDKGLTAQKDASGVYYIVKPGEAGDAAKPVLPYSVIKAKYKLRFLDGTQIQESTDPIEFEFPRNVIPGWYKTIPGKIGQGGKIRLLIPSALAYGLDPGQDLTPNAVLDFDVEVTEVNAQPAGAVSAVFK